MQSMPGIETEVKDQFSRLINAVNRKDASAWSEFYSRDAFVSAIAGTDSFTDRGAWVAQVTEYFDLRERQHLEPADIRVTALAPDLALMTSAETTAMTLKSGASFTFRHAFTMLWKKEPAGWKIVHSHESWVDEPGNAQPQ